MISVVQGLSSRAPGPSAGGRAAKLGFLTGQKMAENKARSIN